MDVARPRSSMSSCIAHGYYTRTTVPRLHDGHNLQISGSCLSDLARTRVLLLLICSTQAWSRPLFACWTIRDIALVQLYELNEHGLKQSNTNITTIFYDGIPIPSNDCTLDTCSLLYSRWGYLPNVPANVLFIVLFALIFLLHIPLGLWRKTWGVLIGMTLGAGLEAAGYIGRVMAHNSPFAFNPFLIYIIFLTIGPAFLSAAVYLCLARIMVIYGQSNARFRPKTYSIVFMFSDFVALVLQGAGGGIASTNSGKNSNKAQMGINVMIAGLAWQVISLTIFVIAAADFMWCVKCKRGEANQDFMGLRRSAKFRAFLWSLAAQIVFIYIRSVYRVAELTEGFTGRIADMEIPYMIFEPTLIFLACLCMTILHPSFVFGKAWQQADLVINGKGRNEGAGHRGEPSGDSQFSYAMDQNHPGPIKSATVTASKASSISTNQVPAR